MSTIADLLVKIGADSSGLSDELKKSKDAINSTFSTNPVKAFSGSIDEASGKINSFIGGFTKLAGIAAGGFGLNAVVQGAVNAGEAVYQLSQKYQITAAQATQLNAIMKLTGGDTDTAAAAIMRFDKNLQSGSKEGQKVRNIMAQMGLSMTDTNGRLKPLNDQIAELSRGYQMARQTGQGQEFIMNTLGVRGMALTKTLLNYNEAAERASKIKGVGLDPTQMHEAYMNMQEVNMQFSKLGVVAGSALAPIVSEILPEVQQDLAGVATWIGKNKTEINELIVAGTKMIAIYEAWKLAKKTITTGTNIATGAKKIFGANDVAKQQAEMTQLTVQQERAINKAIADSDRMYAKRRREAVKTAQQENMSAQETSVFLAEKFAQIGEEAAITAETIRTRMTEAYASINLAANETATGVATANERIITSNTQVSESETATGIAAQEAAGVKAETSATKVVANEEVITSNATVAESEATTGVAAQEAAGVKAEATATKVTANEEVITSNATVAESEEAAGIAATTAGNKAVTASTASAGGLAKVEGKAIEVAKAHTAGGVAAVNAGTKAVGAAGKVASAASKVVSALSLMAGGWIGIAAAAMMAAYWAFRYFNAKYEAAQNNTWDAGDGVTYRAENGKIIKSVKQSGNNSVAEDPSGIGGYSGDGTTETVVTDDEEYAKAYGEIAKNPNSSIAQWEKQQEAEQKQKEADDKLKALTDQLGSFDFGGIDADKPEKESTSKASTEKPTRTAYSFENDEELAQWANQIEYASEVHNIDPRYLAGIIKTESHGRPGEWSSDHEHWGLGQISRAIANQYNGGAGYGEGSDPNQNILAAAAYLSDLYRQTGDYAQAISAYNAGHPTSSNAGYVNTVLGYANSYTAKQVSLSNAENEQPVEYDLPVGELAAYQAMHNYYDGEQWRGQLGNDAAGWCDDFTHQVYADVFVSLGKNNPFGSGVVNDQAFRALGAYHEGDVNAVRGALQPGDLVDTPGHVGIYVGNGMVRSRQSNAGIHDLSLDEFNNTFGGITGYGSLSEATGGMTFKSGLIGQTAVNNAAKEEAMKRANAKQQYATILADLSTALAGENATDYESGITKIEKDIAQRRAKIQNVDKVGGIDTTYAKKLLSEYEDAEVKKLDDKIAKSRQQLADETKKTAAEVSGDFTALYDAEFQKAADALAKEREARVKEVAKHKDDAEAMKAVEDWYTQQYLALSKKREEERHKEFENAIQDATNTGNAERLYNLLNSKGFKNSQDWKGKTKAMSEFYGLWQDANISTMDIAATAAQSIDSGLGNVFSDLGENIQNVGKLAENMGKVVLNTIV